MARVRSSTQQSSHQSFCDLALAPDEGESQSLSRYRFLHGPTHLLACGHRDALTATVTDVAFVLGMLEYGGAEQLTSLWEISGSDEEHMSAWSQPLDGLEGPATNLSPQLEGLIEVMYHAGRYSSAGIVLARWLTLAADRNWPEELQAVHQSSLAVLLIYQGKYQEAEQIDRAVLELRTRLLAEGHKDTSVTLNNLGINLMYQRRSHEAEPFLRRAVQIRRKAYGEDHRETLTSISNLESLIFWRPFDEQAWRDAREPSEAHLNAIESSLGEGSWVYLNHANGHGVLLATLALRMSEPDPDRAWCLDRAVALWEHIVRTLQRLGRMSSQVGLTSLSNIAWIRMERDDPLAKQANEDVLAAKIEVHGPNHPSLRATLATLCTLCGQLDEHKEALKHAQHAVNIAASNAGEGSAHWQESSLLLALCLMKMGNVKEATHIAEQSIEHLSVLEPKEAADISQWLRGLGDEAEEVGDAHHYRFARVCFDAMKQYRVVAYGVGDARTITALNRVALLELRRANNADALVLLTEVHRARSTLYEAGHSKLFSTHWHLAVCLRRLERPAESLVHRREAWLIEVRDKGVLSEEALDVADSLVEDCRVVGDEQTATEVRVQVKAAVSEIDELTAAQQKWLKKIESATSP